MTEKKENLNFTQQVKDYAYGLELDVVGIASADNELFHNAPINHQPKEILDRAKSVIITGKRIPRGTFKLNHHHYNIVHRLYHSIYKYLDICATHISNFLEERGYYAVPIPAYIPLSFRNLEPWGIISLKHAAVAAGLGQIARNGLLIHPKYGTLIRLSGIITTADLQADPLYKGKDICLDCNRCIESCPAQAFDQKGQFQKLVCLRNVVKHGLNVFHPYDKNYVKNLELVTNTLFVEYTVGCTKCLEVCPRND